MVLFRARRGKKKVAEAKLPPAEGKTPPAEANHPPAEAKTPPAEAAVNGMPADVNGASPKPKRQYVKSGKFVGKFNVRQKKKGAGANQEGKAAGKRRTKRDSGRG